jgi:hypothetical protein
MSPDLGMFEFEQPSNSNHKTRDAMHHPQFITPFITQDDCDSPPSSNTRQRRKGTLTQDYMLHMMEQPGYLIIGEFSLKRVLAQSKHNLNFDAF